MEPEEVKHLHCIMDMILTCMDNSHEYCCSECVANEVIDWAKEWLEEVNNGNNS